jgi:hypothetical protein
MYVYQREAAIRDAGVPAVRLSYDQLLGPHSTAAIQSVGRITISHAGDNGRLDCLHHLACQFTGLVPVIVIALGANLLLMLIPLVRDITLAMRAFP